MYMVRSPIHVDGQGNHVYTLQIHARLCSCREWHDYTLPPHEKTEIVMAHSIAIVKIATELQRKRSVGKRVS